MTRRAVAVLGALLAAAGVALGAFGAHGLRAMLDPQRLGWWEIAVQYHLWHAIALVAVAALPIRRPGLPAMLIAAGLLVFSGSLYLMALSGARWLGAVTPIGGGAMIAGWLVLAWRSKEWSRD